MQFLQLMCCPGKHETLAQCWVNVGPSSSTLAQHYPKIGPMSRVCWGGGNTYGDAVVTVAANHNLAREGSVSDDNVR